MREVKNTKAFKSRTLKTVLLTALITTIASAAVAQILLTRQANNTVRVIGAADMLVIRSDTEIEITSINWGDFSPLITSKDSETILGCRICFKNTGNVPLVVGWNATGLSVSRWSITATWAGNPYPENDYSQFRIDPGYRNGYVVFTLTLIDTKTLPGDYNFIINFNAQAAP